VLRDARAREFSLLRVLVEIALGTTVFVAGSMWWQLRKRKALVKEIVTHEVRLAELIVRDALPAPPSNAPTNDSALYPIQLFEIELRTDLYSQRIPRILATIVLLSALVASYFVAAWCVWTNLGIVLLIGLVPVMDSAIKSANDHVLALAAILQRWRLENSAECDSFITPRASLHKLYDAVKRLEIV